jgi:hypothetical protein
MKSRGRRAKKLRSRRRIRIELFEKLQAKFGKTKPWKIGQKTTTEYFAAIWEMKSTTRL